MLYWTLKDAHIIVSPDRVKAIKYIEQDLSMIDVIISDDGLQHYAMFHDIEIAVIDSNRNFGNSLCLPAGPLREPVKRLNTVDLIIINGANDLNSAEKMFSMKIIPQKLINLQTKKSHTIDEFISLKGSFCYAVAAIGNTSRFFSTLKNLGFTMKKYSFSDHHKFKTKDFGLIKNNTVPIIMTHKDAVKCQKFAGKNWYYLEILPKINEKFFKEFDAKLLRINGNK